MCDPAVDTPFITFKGGNCNLIQIYLNSENSTGDSVQSCFENSEVKKEQNQKKVGKKNIKKNNAGKYETTLGRKTKRGKNKTKLGDGKNNKNKIIFNIFDEFKKNAPLYKEFSQFQTIEKNIKNDVYSSSVDLANDMRNLFSSIFLIFYNDSEKYNKTLILCELFEKIYKKYDNQILTKECKNLLKLKFNLGGDEQDNECSVKNYKNQIMSKIQKLNKDQKKGLYNVISTECIDTNVHDNIIEINVNKMTRNQLKQLEKYINQCIKENNCGLSSASAKSLELKRFYEEEKEMDILKNDLSSCLSDDDDEDED